MGQIYAKMKDVCFRDEYSYGLFRNVDTVRRAPDILFSYPMPQVPVKEKQIFVSVIDCAGRDESHGLSQHDESYVQNMARLLNKYRHDGYRLILSSFCSHEGDPKGIEKVLQAMGCKEGPDVQVLSYDGTNTEALTTAIAQSEFVIATRFHATILAIAAGRPVLPILYSDKTKHVLEDLNFGGPVIDIRSCSDYIAVGQPWKQELASVSLSKKAQKHFEKLDEIL